MLPAQSNKEIADYTLQGLRKSFLPKFLTGGFSRRLATCFLEDRVRIAMVLVFIFLLKREPDWPGLRRQATCSAVVHACDRGHNLLFVGICTTLVVPS